MPPTIIMRTAPGTIPMEEIDLTDRIDFFEDEPEDMDAVGENPEGETVRSVRAMRRRFTIDLQRLTTNETDRIRRWVHERRRVAINPNWDETTRLYSRFSRQNLVSLSPGACIGAQPLYARTLSNASAYGTRLLENSQYRTLAANIARYEQSNVLSAFYPLVGARLYGKHVNYFAQSHPASGTLLWTLQNTSGSASWAFNANEPSMIEGLTGAGLFIGNTTDYLHRDITSYGGAGPVSAAVWIRGEGTFSVQFTGGATAEGSSTAASPLLWTMVKLENQTASGATVTMRLNSKANGSWCAVSGAMFQAGRRVTGYVHNMATASAVTQDQDSITYPTFRLTNFAGTIHVGVEMPDLVSAGEQVILGIDHGSGNRTVLKYDGTLAKFYFQKKTSGINVQWTPDRISGRGTIISLNFSKDIYIAYENGVFKASTAVGAAHSMSVGLNVGWDGITDTAGWNGLLFFLRVDEGQLDANEIAYVSNLYNSSDQVQWTRAFEGRLFEIRDKEQRMRAGKNFAEFELAEVYSYRTATTETP